MTAPQTSAVLSIDVKIGSAVSKGQDLILLDNQVLNKEINFINEQLATLTYHNDTNTDVLYQQAIANTEQSVKKAESAQRKYDFYRAKGQVSDVDYTAIVNINNSLNSQLSSQKVAYEDSQRDLRQMQLAGPVAQAHRALMKELVVKQAEKERLTAKAPFDGRILDIFVKKGETVSAGAPLLTMTTNTQPEVVAFLKPKYLEYSQLGSKAKVTYPTVKFILRQYRDRRKRSISYRQNCSVL
ncbi:HlyD family efflux transporter periplasmic adaptor subunit [Plesiomonas shigelloides subsp. oncorhynchi]|nr:HlyD family efflux transporter periplasmic adaptor subunit [Plesiomonas shigelloides]